MFQKVYNDFEMLLNQIYDQITVADGEGNFLKISKSSEKIFGVPENVMVGKNAKTLESQGIFDKSITVRILQSRKQESIIQKTAANKILMVTGFPIFDDRNRIQTIINFSRDVSNENVFNDNLEDTKNLFYWLQEEIIRKKIIENTYVYSKSKRMTDIINLTCQVAKTDATILLLGETGVGKGIMAKTIHEMSPRRNKSFVQVNCGAIPDNLLESELFGYEEGSFTGAVKNGKKGLFEVSHGGSIFLDEIGEMPLNLQVKLLNVLQEREIYKIGALKPVKINCRVIAASNKDLKLMVKQGRFREDLFYRLNVIPIEIPPLRSRREDVPFLVQHLMIKLCHKYGVNKKISVDGLSLLQKYHWPGNIRELENFLERLVITSEKTLLDSGDIINYINPMVNEVIFDDIIPLKKAKEMVETELLLKAYEKYKTTRKIAEILEVEQSTVAKKLKKLKVSNFCP